MNNSKAYKVKKSLSSPISYACIPGVNATNIWLLPFPAFFCSYILSYLILSYLI